MWAAIIPLIPWLVDGTVNLARNAAELKRLYPNGAPFGVALEVLLKPASGEADQRKVAAIMAATGQGYDSNTDSNGIAAMVAAFQGRST